MNSKTVTVWIAQTNAHSAEIVLWTCNRKQPAAVENDAVQHSLSYYTFWDNVRQWNHLDALLTRLAPLSVIHVGGHKVAPRILSNLVQSIEGRSDLLQQTNNDDDDPNGAAETTLVQVHRQCGSMDASRTQSILQQLLNSEQALRVAGDVQISTTHVQKGLAFYFQCLGWWQQSTVEDDYLHACEVQAGVLNSHLVLDRTAASAIHLWPPPNAGQAIVTGGQRHNNSLLGLLSRPIQTKMGHRLLESWLRQPLVQLDPIVQRQEAVALLVQQGVGRDALRDQGLRSLASMDLIKLATQLGQYATDNNDDDDTAFGSTRSALQALYQLYLVASQKIPLLVELLQSALPEDESNETTPSLLQEVSTSLTKVAAELQRSVDLAEAVLDLDQAPREFLVQASYKEELSDIQVELQQLQNDVEECHAEMNELWAQAAGVPNNKNAVRLESSGDGDLDWQFRLANTNDSKILQNQLGDTVKVHKLLKNGVYFSTKELRQLACKKQDLVAEYDRHQRQVVCDAMKVVATYQPVLERASECVALLDVLCALAHVAAYSPHGYCRPVMTDGEEDGLGIELKGARHPCVELQENMEYIPNDISLIFGKSSFLFVTGPNMGGKSCYIRALGAIVTMAQIGSYVPCSAARINICHHILARVGAGDLQEKGISTFMAEMLESSSILRTATKRSLIIIDELGRGTSTFDGYGLARAISEYIVQKIGCMTVFATHFHELTALEDQEAVVKNCHVTAQKGSQGLTFLYEVKPGPCLESFGIQVAEMANMPAVVVQDAKRKAKELENFEYRKQARQADDTDDAMSDEHTAAEDAAAAIDFVNRFRRMPLQSILAKSCASDAEKQAAILEALEG